MDPISIFRNYMGEDLNPSCIKRLAQGPADHIGIFCQLLSTYYRECVRNEVKDRADAVGVNADGSERPPTYYCINPRIYFTPWTKQFDIYKKYLLYFPRFAVCDPVAEFFYPYDIASSVMGGVPVDDSFRTDFQNALLLLEILAPAVLKNDVVLVPRTYAADHTAIQKPVAMEMKTIKSDKEYWKPLYDIAEQCETAQEMVETVVGYVQVEGQFCAKFDFTPIPGDILSYKILDQDYDRAKRYLHAPKKMSMATQTMLQYDLPGVKKASFESIMVLRNNEAAFEEWRRALADVLNKARDQQPKEERQFEIEFREAADTLLMSRVKELEKATKSPILEKILIPGSMTLGAGAVAFYVAGLSVFPATAIAGAALAPVSWVIDKVVKRFNKSGRKAAVLREFTGCLLE